MVKTSFIEISYVVCTHCNCFKEPIRICTNKICYDNKKTYFEVFTDKVSCPLSVPPLDISNCESV